VTGHASVDLEVGGVPLHRETDGVAPNSGDAVKTFVDAFITLTPLTDTNLVNDPHTVTATVQQDDGLSAAQGGDGVDGFGPAPDGTVVSFTLLNNTAGADFVDDGVDSDGDTINGNDCVIAGGAGMCSIQINSSSPGSVDIHGETMFLVGGVLLTRATGTGGLNGPDVEKIYVNAQIDIEKCVEKVDDGDGGGEGLTPGFWKTHSRYGPAPEAGWPETGFDPDDSFNALFGVSATGNPTLLEALNAGGGGEFALQRHATAALLNASHPNIDYEFTVAEVIAMVQAAYASGDFETTKDIFAEQNELGGDLSNGGGGGGGGGNGECLDADDPPGLIVNVGDTVMFTYTVTNPGDVPLANVVVVDDNETPADPSDDFSPTFVGGDVNMDGLLDLEETWIYTATKVVVSAGQHKNVATVTGEAPNGDEVTDNDPAHWFAQEDEPPVGAEGCTPGFWKQPQHFQFWTNYSTTDLFDAVFGVDAPGNLTLLQTLKQGGGGTSALGRHAVAALLNAASASVDYAFSEAQVIALVQHAYATGNFEGIKNQLEDENERGCDLGAGATAGGAKKLVSENGTVSDTVVADGGIAISGELAIAVHDAEGQLDVDATARIQAALSSLNSGLAPYGVSLAAVASSDPADIHVYVASTSACGSAADGVLGCESDWGEITLLLGWDWYSGADPAAISAGQYDLQTIVMHELGHGLRLAHSSNDQSAMYPVLATGVARRAIPDAELATVGEHEDHEGNHALIAKPFLGEQAGGHGPNCPHCQEIMRQVLEVSTASEPAWGLDVSSLIADSVSREGFSGILSRAAGRDALLAYDTDRLWDSDAQWPVSRGILNGLRSDDGDEGSLLGTVFDGRNRSLATGRDADVQDLVLAELVRSAGRADADSDAKGMRAAKQSELHLLLLQDMLDNGSEQAQTD
jgi:hypothetical protein